MGYIEMGAQKFIALHTTIIITQSIGPTKSPGLKIIVSVLH